MRRRGAARLVREQMARQWRVTLAPRGMLWPGGAIFLLPAIETALHAHHAIQLSVALEGDLLARGSAAEGWWSTRGALAGRNCQHAILCRQPVAVLYVDPLSRLGRTTMAALGTRGIGRVPPDALTAFRRHLRRSDRPALSVPLVRDAFRSVAKALGGGNHPAPPPLDGRVARTLDRLRREPVAQQVPLARLAAEVGLSERRLAQLFSQGVGIPIRRYVLWLRLVAAIGHLAGGRGAAEAAMEAGFSDAAHMSRTFQQVFAVPPMAFRRTFLPDCQIVQDSPSDHA